MEQLFLLNSRQALGDSVQLYSNMSNRSLNQKGPHQSITCRIVILEDVVFDMWSPPVSGRDLAHDHNSVCHTFIWML